MAKKQKKRTTPRAWTKMDVRTLKQFSRDKLPVARISKTLKRTVGALRQKASSLGLSLGHRRRAKKRRTQRA
jgi:hypothetical protein